MLEALVTVELLFLRQIQTGERKGWSTERLEHLRLVLDEIQWQLKMCREEIKRRGL